MAFQSFDVTTNPANGARASLNCVKNGRARARRFSCPARRRTSGRICATSCAAPWLADRVHRMAGAALILRKSAYIFVDGRYELQVRTQTDPQVFSYESLVSNPPASWLAENGKGLNIGFDPWLHTISEAEALRVALENRAVSLFRSKSIWSTQSGTTNRKRRQRMSLSSLPVSPVTKPETRSGRCRLLSLQVAQAPRF